MSQKIADDATLRKARIAGGLYVLIILVAVFAPFQVVPSGLMRGGVALSEAAASRTLYFLGGFAELLVYACDVAVALLFYDLLKPVARSLALLAAFFRLAYAAIAAANVLNHFAPLLLLGEAGHPPAFNHDRMRELAAALLRLHTTGFDIALVFFGFHCAAAGYLFFRSGFCPRILGALLALGGVGYILNIAAGFLRSAVAAYLFPYALAPAGIAEVSLAVWLLMVRRTRWNRS